MKYCILCGLPLNRRTPWWARLIALTPPPTHDPDGPDGDACWRGFNERMGLDPNRPKPSTKRRSTT